MTNGRHAIKEILNLYRELIFISFVQGFLFLRDMYNDRILPVYTNLHKSYIGMGEIQ